MKMEEAAYTYFSIISLLNNLNLREKELRLISSLFIEKEFNRNKWIESNNSSIGSYYNMRNRLTKRQVIVKGKINPFLQQDLKHINLFININGKTE